MRILLVHPEDSPRRGPWSQQRWDLLVDLGKSSAFAAEAWSHQYDCPVLQSDAFRRAVSDVTLVRKMLSAGRGQLLDEQGIDWWDLTSLRIAANATEALALRRMCAEIAASAELWSTRNAGPVKLIASLLGRELRSFRQSRLQRGASRAAHYSKVLRNFSGAQIREIFLDKYDSEYQWRSRISARTTRQKEPVILLPSAYQNVSNTAAAYARLLPEQKFLMVVTRQNARQFLKPPNIELQGLAAYVRPGVTTSEASYLVQRWRGLRSDLLNSPELRTLDSIGTFDPFPGWLRDGLVVREAWREVMKREPISAVLCGDDSNPHTRLPVLLAAKSNIRTVDFHHGAFDGRYLLKDLPCDVYLAKHEVERDYLVRICGLPDERIVIGAPLAGSAGAREWRPAEEGESAIFFSEPYEAAGMRGDEVYRELLPRLCRLVRENGRQGVIVKLHPFESVYQREHMITEILNHDDRALTRVVGGRITDALMKQAWFGITVESTTVMDSVAKGIRCFLCGWLRLTSYGYLEQFARFGIGEVLESAEDVAGIAERLGKVPARPGSGAVFHEIDPRTLKQYLTSSESHNVESPAS